MTERDGKSQAPSEARFLEGFEALAQLEQIFGDTETALAALSLLELFERVADEAKARSSGLPTDLG